MKSKTLFLVTITFWFASTAFGQFNLEWMNSYEGYGLQFSFWCMDVDIKGNTYAVGNDYEGTKVIKVDASGNLDWVFNDTISHFKFFVKADNETNSIVANRRSDSNGYDFVSIQKFSSLGTLLWEYIYPHFGSDVPLGLKLDEQNNIYVSFVKRSYNYDTTYGVGLLKLDAAGNLLWENLNPNDKVWWDRNFEILPDHSIINEYYSFRDTVLGYITDSHLYKINSFGQTVWEVDSLWQTTTDVSVDQFKNSYLSVENDSEFYLLKYDSSGHQLLKTILFNDVYFTGDYYFGDSIDRHTYFTSGKLITKSALYLVVDENHSHLSPNMEAFKIHLLKIDFNGNIVWQHDYENPAIECSVGRNLFKAHDGNLILEGFEIPDSFHYSISQVFLLALDTFGNELCKTTVVLDSTYGNAVADYNGTAIDDSDNVYYCVMDGLTSLETRKFDYTPVPGPNVNVNSITDASLNLKLFPDPASDVLNIETGSPSKNASLQMINSLGQIVLETKLKPDQSRTTIDVSHLTPGIYWVMMKTENYIRNEKVIVTR